MKEKYNETCSYRKGKEVMKFRIKDPGSAITHFIGMIMAAIAAVPLIIKAMSEADATCVRTLVIFAISMVMLYAASTIYHTFDVSEKVNKTLRKVDHMMIFVLIAGTYTPVCVVLLEKPVGYILLGLVWGISLIGIAINILWINCPKWFSSLMYIALGWVVVFAFPQIMKVLPVSGFAWLLAGGIIYTIGGVIYALKLPIFNSLHKNFGSHEIFHLFVMGGSLCHFIFMFNFVI